MALFGLHVGLSLGDMRRMKYTHLTQLLWEWEDMRGAGEDDGTREATTADVMALTRL